MKSKLRVSLVLMLLTILVISAFQVYWLRNNFKEEQHIFNVRTNLLFRETIFRLQAAKLKLDSNIHVKVEDKKGIITMTNVLMERVKDSVPGSKEKAKAFVISVNRDGVDAQMDSNVHFKTRKLENSGVGGPVFDFLRGVDSLHDSITIKELTEQYKVALTKQKTNLPFVITEAKNATANTYVLPDADINKVQVGFSNPKVYQLDFINSSWYIIKRMWQPILISLLLVGVTIASFLLLYRNLVKQQKLTQLKNDFIGNITHELKTPIATVSVAIEALKNFNALQDPQRTKEYLDISGNEIQRLGLLVDKVLKLSMYENKEIILQKEAVDLALLAEEVVASMKLQFDKKNVQVTTQTNGEHFVIQADRLHMTSVIYNLLDNALKYSKENPRIDVDITDHGQYLSLTVKDNGIGIPAEYKSKVFEQFFRVQDGNKHNIKGYGLGLSYVNHIVHLHLGFIGLQTKLGEGSSFTVNLPFKEATVIDYGNGRKIRKISFKVGKG